MTEAEARQVGRLYKQARRAKKLSLRRVDELSGVSYGWIGDLERGHLAQPASSKLMKVATVLAIPPERVDRMTRGQLARELPPFRTFFRVKFHLTTEEIREIEEVFERIRRNRREASLDPEDYVDEGQPD